jgi:hypothetical protein
MNADKRRSGRASRRRREGTKFKMEIASPPGGKSGVNHLICPAAKSSLAAGYEVEQ